MRTAIIGGLALFSLLLLLRIFPPAAFMAFALGCTISFFLLGTKVFKSIRIAAMPDDRSQPDDEFGRRVKNRLKDCRQREERFREEGEKIMRSITTLREDLARNKSVTTDETEKAEQTIKELEAEFSLRHAKAAFFADCATKLEELRDRHRLVESIAARRRELRDLRETNFDDEATVEETRYHIEQDTIELDTIVELSNSALNTSKIEQARSLRNRLEQIRAALRNS